MVKCPKKQLASMGPQPFDCGNGDVSIDDRPPAGAASMGPQPFDCGNSESASPDDGLQDASMGPQPFDCGNSKSFADAHAGRTSLQWGRSLSTAEMRCLSSSDAIASNSFNGAAAFRLRKSGLEEDEREERFAASMGPQPFDCGNRLANLNVVIRNRSHAGTQFSIN